ncbi:catechol 1,2-dioxygenase [Arsenicitalea aurantiaca]|uniref:Catechol 1,2-dioxygenase n=1 Tax=Arsenicitalea aurantiaca TaxID=1783274 RepID=A0A433X411_9HYPH|nr:VOC family protein [Arsenicitalea aurantiaca]RUT28798.1 catechol 1,2-dioxygenase [Arsenicitalea aurantiaca]
MFPVESQSSVRSAPLLPLSTTLGPVHIAVTDRAEALAIWGDVVGLELLSETDGVLSLGVGGKPLIVLETGARTRVTPRTLGLYHVAIHVPTRAEMAQLVVRALRANVRIAPTDHLVSEAIYLWDHDGNGIEITFETPWRGTLGDPEAGAYAVTADGRPHSGREPIDLEDLLGELGPDPVLSPLMPAGTRIGHVHVHVRDLDEAMRFYRDGLGFGGLFIIRAFGMGDVGLHYTPHAIAFNVWAGPDARLPAPDSAGLRFFAINLPDAAALAGVRSRLAAMKVSTTEIEGGIETRDPSGNRLRVLLS